MNAWDENASEWARRVSAGLDVSREHLVLPAIVEILTDLGGSRILDAGCGTGSLGFRLSELTSTRVVGVDLSSAMCRAAVQDAVDLDELAFIQADVARLPLRGEAFDTVVANMVLHGVANLDLCVGELARSLQRGGWLVFSILHPARVMPVQSAAAATPADATAGGAVGAIEDYMRERHIDARLRLGEVTWLPAPVRYHHRMLSTYAAALRASGLVTIDLVEPLPSADLVKRFGYMRAFWSLAPFLVWVARKQGGRNAP